MDIRRKISPALKRINSDQVLDVAERFATLVAQHSSRPKVVRSATVLATGIRHWVEIREQRALIEGTDGDVHGTP